MAAELTELTRSAMLRSLRQYYVVQLLLGSLALLAIGCIKLDRDLGAEDVERQAAEVAAGKDDELHFYDVRSTDELLRKYSSLPGVKRLVFEPCRLTDAGVAGIPNFAELEEVTFFRQRVTDNWLQILQACPRLATLELELDSYPDFRMDKVLALPHLRDFSLALHASEGDVEFAQLELWIDEALVLLHEAKQLKQLTLNGNCFSERRDAIDQLQKALPDCDIRANLARKPSQLPRNVGTHWPRRA